MKRVRPYLPILWTLVINVWNLLWRVTRRTALPIPGRTGNLLTSLFVLFEGLVENVVGCRRAMIGIPSDLSIKIPAQDKLKLAWSHGKVWLRRGVLVATWALFILTSLEWRAGERREFDPSGQTVAISATAEVAAPAISELLPLQPVFCPRIVDCPVSLEPRAKRWLLLCTLRI